MMKRTILCFLLATVTISQTSAQRTGPWPKEKAWEWYESQPWIRGCNYMSADCANRVDQWQKLGFEERFKTQEKELALAESIGFNTLRLIFGDEGFGVWLADRKGFMKRFEQTLELMDRHQMKAIVVFGNDCSRPKELWKLPKPGKQYYDWGYHGGRKQSQHGSFPGAVGYTCLDDSKLAPKFYEMCREVLTRYKDDDRILFWNLWNEPGNNNRDKLTEVNMRKLFELAWEIDPKQPLAADVWHNFYNDNLSGDLSDIISFHLYREMESNKRLASDLRERYDRPLINTEWMARIIDSNVFDLYPWFEQQHIGCVMWGFVAGKYQTYEPWEGMWKKIENGNGQNYHMTRWFHDLYRPSLRPYDPDEINIITNINRQADIEFGTAPGKTVRQTLVSGCQILSEDSWKDFRRTDFLFHGCRAWIVEPSVKVAESSPWIWSMLDSEDFVERMGVLELIKEGWHYAGIDSKDLSVLNMFHNYVSSALDLSVKAGLIGTGNNGIVATMYATSYPSDIDRMYLDSPILLLDSICPETLAADFCSTGVPVLVLYGAQDMVAVPEENCLAFIQKMKEYNGRIKVIGRELFGHFPYGLDPGKTEPIVSFLKSLD